MPLEERRIRHQALLESCQQQDLHWWCDRFLSALRNAKAHESGSRRLRL
jgi:trehalose 6-phosphate synthase